MSSLGSRWLCLICDRKFYDLGRDKIVCPICKGCDVEISSKAAQKAEQLDNPHCGLCKKPLHSISGDYKHKWVCLPCNFVFTDEQVRKAQKIIKDKTNSPTGGSMELVQKKFKNGDFTSKVKDIGVLHCEDGPAECFGTNKNWYWMGQLHRVGGPASESNHSDTYHFMGLEHNLDGPAHIPKNGCYGKPTHYVFGKYFSTPKFKKLQANKELMKKLREMEKAMMPKSIACEVVADEKKAAKAKPTTTSSFLPALAAGGLLAGAGMLFAKNLSSAVKNQQAATKTA